MSAPILHTERLTLRPHEMADFPAYAAALGSLRARFMGGPFDLRGAWLQFASDVAQWGLRGCGALAVVRRGDHSVIGQVGLNHLPHFPEREIGWLAYEGFEGQGYITEAARALRGFARKDLGWAALVSYIAPGNTRSIALAERLGAVLDPAAQAPAGDPCLVYRHPQTEEAA